MTTDEYLNSLNNNFTVEGDEIQMKKPVFVPNEDSTRPMVYDGTIDFSDIWNKVSSFAPFISTYQDARQMYEDPSIFNGLNLAVSAGADALTTASMIGSVMTGGALSPTLGLGTALKTGAKSALRGIFNHSNSIFKPAVNFMAKENGERILTNAARSAGRFDKVYNIEKGLDFVRKYGWQYGRNTHGRLFGNPRLFLKGNHYMDLTKGIYGLDATLNMFQQGVDEFEQRQKAADEMNRRNNPQSVKDKTKQVFSVPPKKPTSNDTQGVAPTMQETWSKYATPVQFNPQLKWD
jgi:hypothetical protein